MEKVKKILEMARNGTPQALARFNDGEVGIMFNKDFVAARGHQKGTIELQVALRDAINYRQANYWIGYPCPVCMEKQRHQVVNAGYYDPEYLYNTLAVVNTNRNWNDFSTGLVGALEGKEVIWVSGEDQNVNELGFNIVEHVKFNRKNSWNQYESILAICKGHVMPHRVFIFSCGPTARVLVKNLFEVYPKATFLDLGSTYDPYTRDVWHKCHKGTLKPCPGCN